MKLVETINVGCDETEHLLIRFSAFVRYWRKKWEYNETVHQLFIDFKKAYDSVRREVLPECRSKSGHKIANRSFENVSQFKY
jgi:hypothetical protein